VSSRWQFRRCTVLGRNALNSRHESGRRLISVAVPELPGTSRPNAFRSPLDEISKWTNAIGKLLDNPRNEFHERIERKFIAFVTLLAEW
jgi:hypothetical protein